MRRKDLPRAQYQIFPPLPPNRRQALRESIRMHGVEAPTTWDERGHLLDGWEREDIADELGLTCPREVRQFDTEADRFRFVLAVNAHRRPSLSQRQKRAVIEAYLLGDPALADNALGEALGVSRNTVLRARRRLEAGGRIPELDKTRGRDGKSRPVRYKKVLANTPGEFRRALELIGDLPESCAGRLVDLATARRSTREARRRKAAEAASAGGAGPTRGCSAPTAGTSCPRSRRTPSTPW